MNLAPTIILLITLLVTSCVPETNKKCKENQVLVNGSCVLKEESISPTPKPTVTPIPTTTIQPTVVPTIVPTIVPPIGPTTAPTIVPTILPTPIPTVQPKLSCGNIPHGGTESRVAYSQSSVSFGQSCSSIQQTQTRTCNNGNWSAWSGTYTYLSCVIQSPLNCGQIAHGSYESRTMYKTATVSEGQSCISEIQKRLCTNGQLGNWSGTYTQTSCVVVSNTPPGNGCDCGSTDQNNPCVGNSIITTVKATTINNTNSQNGIFQWKFSSGGKPVRCGQFANGDYWVAPAIGQADVTFESISGSSAISVDADPVLENMGLLDGSKKYGNYNVAEDVSKNLPAKFSKITSLVAALKRDEAKTGNCGTSAIVGECVDAYQVITVLTSVPALAGTNMIRPNITGSVKVILTLDDFDFSRLKTNALFSGTDSQGFEGIRQRWSHSTEIFGFGGYHESAKIYAGYSEGGRAFRSHILIDDYGAGWAKRFHEDMLIMLSPANNIEEKKKALAAMISYGLDAYFSMFHTSENRTRKWLSGAGQSPGRFPVTVFMAALEKSGKFANDLKTVATLSNDLQPQELAQVHVGPNGPVWGDDNGVRRYFTDMFASQCYEGASGTCVTNNGKRTAADPFKYIDGPANKPGTSYFGIGTGSIMNLTAMMFLIPQICSIVNTDKTIKFIDRVKNHGLKTLPDPCVTPDDREIGGDPNCNIWTGAKNCNYYYPTAKIEPTWGPIGGLEDASKGCVTKITSGHTQQGRFASLDGTPATISSSYTANKIYYEWAKIRGISETCNKINNQ